MIVRAGTNGLIIGKKAMRVSGCPRCGTMGLPGLGTVVTVAAFEETNIFECDSCNLEILATLFVSTEGKLGMCPFYRLMPDVDESETTEEVIELINQT